MHVLVPFLSSLVYSTDTVTQRLRAYLKLLPNRFRPSTVGHLFLQHYLVDCSGHKNTFS